MLQDLRYAIRMLRKQPGFTLVAALSLAVGIGATTTVFGVINAVLLRPLPVRDAGSLVSINKPEDGSSQMHVVSWPDYRDYVAATAGTFSELAGWSEAPVSLDVQGQAQRMYAMLVTPNYFRTLGVGAALGRVIADDDRTAAVAVLSYRLWERQYAADSAVIGRTVVLNGQPFTIIGVAPRAFTSTYSAFAPSFYAPLELYGQLLANPGAMESRGHKNVKLTGRLEPGVTRTQANEVLSAIDRRLEQEFAPVGETSDVPNLGLEVASVGSYPFEIRLAMFGAAALLLAIVGSVLLIACANVAGMLLARATARRREVAVRLAMGATRRRLIRQLLTESTLLFLLAGTMGTALTAILTRLLRTIPIPASLPVAIEPGIDWRVLGFTLVLALLTGLVFGLAPAFEALRVDLHSALKAVPAAGGLRRSKLRPAFVIAQIALSLMLLLSAGALSRALSYGQTVYPGKGPQTVLTARLDPEPLGYDLPRARALYAQLTERMAALPNVENVSMTRFLDVGMGYSNTEVSLPDQPALGSVRVTSATITPDYFRTLGITLKAGREFRATDRDSAPRVVIINEAAAQRFWPGASAIGRVVGSGPDWRAEVVGVVENGRHRAQGEAVPPAVYGPFAQSRSDNAGMTILIRFRGDAGPVISALRRETRALDSRLPLQSVATLSGAVEAATLPWQAAGTLATTFGLIGLALAAMGIYGLVSFTVGQRTRELGVRIALGAASHDIRKLVLGQGSKLALIGVVTGIALAFGATQALAAFLFGVRATDPIGWLGTSALLWLVTMAASWIPARRAIGTDPLVALREE